MGMSSTMDFSGLHFYIKVLIQGFPPAFPFGNYGQEAMSFMVGLLAEGFSPDVTTVIVKVL